MENSLDDHTNISNLARRCNSGSEFIEEEGEGKYKICL